MTNLNRATSMPCDLGVAAGRGSPFHSLATRNELHAHRHLPLRSGPGEIPRRPRTLTNCNCSICRRYGVLWAYYKAETVQVTGAPLATMAYSWGTSASDSSAAARAAALRTGSESSPRPGARSASMHTISIQACWGRCASVCSTARQRGSTLTERDAVA